MLSIFAVSGCDRSRIARGNVLSLGDPCTEKSRCRAPLVCGDDGTCSPSGTSQLGEACSISLDCAPDLYCAAGVCAEAGDGIAGDVCSSSADCQRGLRCGFVGLGGTCIEAGDGYVEEACTGSDECMAGLICDPIQNECNTTLSRPAGTTCQSDLQCMPQEGIVCDTTTGKCGGLGPDGSAIVPWRGVQCGDPFELDGQFRAYFEVPGTANEDFFRLPYPNDARVDPNTGRIDLAGFPTPPLASVPSNLLEKYIQAIEADQERFGPNQSVFFRFSGPPVFCGQGCGETGAPATEPGCIGNGESAPGLYVVDLTRNGGGMFSSSPFTPIPYRWTATSANDAYICGPWLGLIPDAARSWRPGGTYAVFIHSRVKGCDGDDRVAIDRDDDFAAMLAASAPSDARLTRAWNAYEPLRSWLATNPTYSDMTPVAATDIAAATVFTIGNPARPMAALRDAALAAAVPAVSGVQVCTSSSAAAECSTPGAFVEVHGTVSLPSYQTGAAPYVESGGGISSTTTGDVDARFALTLPVTTNGCAQPVGGWPVVVYGHGTGGNYRTHVEDGVAEALAKVTNGAEVDCFAVLGIDQVAHGLRRGSATIASELLFFNFGNPQAARGNVLQAATDQLSLRRAIAAISAAIAGNASLGGAALDATQVAYFGHSQGGVVGALSLAVSADYPVGVLSGAGGGLLDSFTNKKTPYDLLTIFRFVLADPKLEDAREHPALSLVQGYLEPTDPSNYGALINATPPTGSIAKSVLHIVGVGDTYTPNVTGMTLARRIAGAYMDASPASGLLRGGETSTAGPINKNRGGTTVVTTIHAPPSMRDGHFVVFDDAKAEERMTKFFGTWQSNADGSPTVVP